jgi:hypothetical protein
MESSPRESNVETARRDRNLMSAPATERTRGSKMSELRCYCCGKAIENEKDITMKNVSVGWFNSERKPFHTECWRKYHRIRMKKDAIGYIAIADGAFLLFGAWLFLVSGTLGLVALILCIALFISLGIAYYRIEE